MSDLSFFLFLFLFHNFDDRERDGGGKFTTTIFLKGGDIVKRSFRLIRAKEEMVVWPGSWSARFRRDRSIYRSRSLPKAPSKRVWIKEGGKGKWGMLETNEMATGEWDKGLEESHGGKVVGIDQ